METRSHALSIAMGIHRWPAVSPHKGPVMHNFDIFLLALAVAVAAAVVVAVRPRPPLVTCLRSRLPARRPLEDCGNPRSPQALGRCASYALPRSVVCRVREVVWRCRSATAAVSPSGMVPCWRQDIGSQLNHSRAEFIFSKEFICIFYHFSTPRWRG